MTRLDQIELTPSERQVVRAAAALLRAHFPVERVVLFGSRARGQAAEGSDYDLLVLTTRPVDWPERNRISDAVYGLELELGVLFNLLVLSQEKWEHGVYQVLPIRDEIDRDGVAV